MAQVNIRIDDNLKAQADALFDELGLNMTTAFNIFVRQTVRQGGIPFAITTETERNERKSARENLDALLKFASTHRQIEKDYMFKRDDAYDR
ncbi:hypothetical protein FACS1894191_2940 [Clostridia bacterium]|nr:hypothetical protein FACS1894191_2940 [Clostridia bacterium]